MKHHKYPVTFKSVILWIFQKLNTNTAIQSSTGLLGICFYFEDVIKIYYTGHEVMYFSDSLSNIANSQSSAEHKV